MVSCLSMPAFAVKQVFFGLLKVNGSHLISLEMVQKLVIETKSKWTIKISWKNVAHKLPRILFRFNSCWTPGNYIGKNCACEYAEKSKEDANGIKSVCLTLGATITVLMIMLAGTGGEGVGGGEAQHTAGAGGCGQRKRNRLS